MKVKRTVSAETRRKISKSMRGKKNAAKPHKLSPEGRQAISEAQRRRWKRFREERASA